MDLEPAKEHIKPCNIVLAKQQSESNDAQHGL